tara:strand:- start:140891 stop:141067 length:177 start_codon:yes stop_codon:yes gene_type:complete
MVWEIVKDLPGFKNIGGLIESREFYFLLSFFQSLIELGKRWIIGLRQFYFPKLIALKS